MSIKIDKETKEYSITNSTGEGLIHDNDLSLFMYLYINKGLGKSQIECREILNRAGCDITVKELRYMLKVFDITKDSPYILTPLDIQIFGINSDIEDSNIENAKIRYKEVENNYLVETIVNRLGGSIQAIEVPSINTKELNIQENKKGIVVILSDWHVGKRVTAPSKNRYDSKIFVERLHRILDKVSSYSKRVDNVSELAVVFLGDMVEGPMSNLRASQAQNLEMFDYEQIDFAARNVANCISEIVNIFGLPAKIAAVGGNHDRMTTKKTDDLLRTGHRLVMNSAKKYLKNLEKDKLVSWLNIEKRVFAFSMGQSRIILSHGDSACKPERFIMLDNAHGSPNKIYIQGHLHSRQFIEKDGYLHIISPSLVGPTCYEEYELGHRSYPGQSMLEIDYKTHSNNIRWLDIG